MSPTDLLTLDFLDQLVDAGVSVLKLEGRARSPEYVGAVVSAYRVALDAIAAGTYDQALVKSLMPQLNEVYNRGYGSGFYLGRKENWSKAAGSRATHRKVLVGPIEKVYGKAGVVVANVTASDLKEGDSYLIVGPTTGVLKGTVNGLRVDGTDATHAKKGDLVSFAVSEKVRLSDRLFKMVPVA